MDIRVNIRAMENPVEPDMWIPNSGNTSIWATQAINRPDSWFRDISMKDIFLDWAVLVFIREPHTTTQSTLS